MYVSDRLPLQLALQVCPLEMDRAGVVSVVAIDAASIVHISLRILDRNFEDLRRVAEDPDRLHTCHQRV